MFIVLATGYHAKTRFTKVKRFIVEAPGVKKTEFLGVDEALNICWVCFTNLFTKIRQQCRKTAVLSCHRCLINTGIEKMSNI
jgi:hypothetical protein